MTSLSSDPLIPSEKFNLKIYGWLADHHGCGYYRLKMPLMALHKRGHHITLTTKSFDEPFSFSATVNNFINPTGYLDTLMPRPINPRQQVVATHADVLVGQRISNTGPSNLWQSLAKKPFESRPLMVFEVDDDLLNIHPSNKQAYAAYSAPDVRARFIQNMRVADKVTVSTPYLAEEYKKYNSNIFAVPNTIPESLIDSPSTARTDGVITVGWAGSPTHQMDWDEVSGSIGTVIRESSNVEMHMVGWDYSSSLRLPEEKIRLTEWIDGIPNYWRAIDFHIGLAPIRNHKFNLSKSHIKCLEYAAKGIPVIASNVGPYQDFVKHGETGFLANNERDWMEYLRILIKDENLRTKMGEQAKEFARQWTIERWSKAWEHTLTTI